MKYSKKLPKSKMMAMATGDGNRRLATGDGDRRPPRIEHENF
jgi:hypothetical protein